ncbi:MAG: hypothetical protein DSZ29_00465 [Aquificaceae bacterium]|nr:MAG: hypothetical protein DSZ29_00465 [Aquificaceae bacterium]
MKKSVLAVSVSLACVFAATTASADYPNVVIDSEVLLNYDQDIDMTGAINIPTVDMGDEADISVNQFNHDSPVRATGSVINNRPTGVNGQVITEIKTNVTAVGNNASVEINNDNMTIGAVQGNQNGGATAIGNISGNRVDLNEDGIVELNVTAVGNNLSVKTPDDNELSGTTIGSMQFNYDSPVNATGSITGNGFGVNPMGRGWRGRPRGIDPKLTVTAVGNNLSSIMGTSGSMTQINRNSTIRATGLVSRNVGAVGPISADVTAVGNNISIKAPTVD